MTNNNHDQLSVQEDQPSDWFEPLYADSNTSGDGVPWANMETHPSFRKWLTRNPTKRDGKTALVVGCGMGDDAVELESLGFQTTAFDVSESAVKFCNQRFPKSSVNFLQADLLKRQPQWHKKFDFVLEIFTIQALPPKYENEIIRNMSGFVAPGGQILVIADVSSEERSFKKGPPWPLTTQHIESFEACGLRVSGNVEREPSDFGDLGTFVTALKRPDQ